jgi:hypothetical protein
MVSSRTFDRFEGDKTLLLVFAPSEEDDRFDGQLLCLNDYKQSALRRDLVLYEIFADGESRVAGEPLPEVDADALRKRFGVGKEDFLLAVVGRDGAEAFRSEEPLPPPELFRRVDALRRAAPRSEGLSR